MLHFLFRQIVVIIKLNLSNISPDYLWASVRLLITLQRPLKVPGRYEKCLRVPSSMTRKALPTPHSGR